MTLLLATRAVCRVGACLVALAVAGVTRPAAAQRALDVRRRLGPTDSVRLRVNVARAVIRVVGWDKDSVAVAGTLSKGAQLDTTRSSARLARISVDAEASPDPKSTGADVVVYVPARARVWVTGPSPELEVTDFRGELDINVVGGKVRVRGVPRAVTVEAMEGDVDLAASIRTLRVGTAGGAITMRGSSDDAILSSVSGDITVGEGKFARGTFKSVTGDVLFAGAVLPGGMIAFDTHAGKIELRVPPAMAAEYDVVTFGGEIRNGLSKAMPVPAPQGHGRELHFTIGTGGASVMIRSFKGPILLLAQPAGSK